jgi:hypothetical protein
LTAQEVFEAMAPHVGPIIEREYGTRGLCILATRVAIETAAYFGVEAGAAPVKVVAYNAAFARHVAVNFADVDDKTKPGAWGDGSWSVGIGCGAPKRFNGWDGHLIAVADGWFADYSISQVSRPQHGIVIPPALVGPHYGGEAWKAENNGVVIEYRRIDDDFWRNAPDWRDPVRRRKLVGPIIRELRQRKQVTRLIHPATTQTGPTQTDGVR